MDKLIELADAIRETINEADEWARKNTGGSAQETFVAQVAIGGTLGLLERKLRTRAAPTSEETGGAGVLGLRDGR